jgi:heme exporter protein A
MIVLACRSLSCERDDRSLFRALSFELAQGDVLHLEGPNGSGKTTLLRILSGLYDTYEGTVCWQGQDIRRCGLDYRSQLLVLGHKPAIRLSLSPLENLCFLCGLHQRPDLERVHEALARIGLDGYETVACRNLSAGQVRRVSLARLFLSTARLWLLDEMFTAIDRRGVAQLEALLAEKARSGVAIVMTTHHEPLIEGVRKLRLG